MADSWSVSRPLPPLLLLMLAVGCGPQEVSLEGDLEGPPAELFSSLPQGLVTCDERQDTGYTSGTPFAITVVTCDSKPCERDTANAYAVMQQAAAADGVKLVVVSGFRTQVEQQYLYGCYTNCNCNNCNLAAKPGYSNHQSGHALDLNTASPGVLAWLNANGGAFGFKRTVPSEDWHWEWWGGGPGGGPCGLTQYGCTTGEAANCAQYGCGCQDHACSGGFCPGSGCTSEETNACTVQGCGCADHACSGGACAGDGCTASQREGCADAGRACGMGACGEPLAPLPGDGETPPPGPDAGVGPAPTLEAAVGTFGCNAPGASAPTLPWALLLAGHWLVRGRLRQRR